MGLIAESFASLARVLPERKIAVGASIPTWQQGTPQYQKESYFRYALEGYSRNEIVFACIEELATSAAEPMMKALDAEGEPIKSHPILDLLDRPNPFLDRFQFWATVIMHLSISGNAYIEKVRSAAGQVVELWLLRPDRMFVIPDERRYIGGYEYRIAEQVKQIDANDIVHLRYRNPLDDFYGLPPLAVAAQRVDTDNWMRSFTGSFFRNAGVPSGMLTFTGQSNETKRQLIQDRFRNSTGGPGGWHSLLVLDNTEATYTAMGLPLGERGLVLPELDEISETRIAMVFGVPQELIGARLSMRGQRSAAHEARAGFWDETLIPLYMMLAEPLNTALVTEFSGVDRVEFDLSTVRALQEDEDAKSTRVLAQLGAGAISVQEARVDLGREPDFEAGAILILPDNLSPLPVEQLTAPPPPDPAALGAAGALPPGTQNGHANGAANGGAQMTPSDLAALQELAAGR